MQFDGFGAETNEPNTKFKRVWGPGGGGGGSTQIPWYMKWALEILQWTHSSPKFMNSIEDLSRKSKPFLS